MTAADPVQYRLLNDDELTQIGDELSVFSDADVQSESKDWFPCVASAGRLVATAKTATPSIRFRRKMENSK